MCVDQDPDTGTGHAIDRNLNFDADRAVAAFPQEAWVDDTRRLTGACTRHDGVHRESDIAW